MLATLGNLFTSLGHTQANFVMDPYFHKNESETKYDIEGQKEEEQEDSGRVAPVYAPRFMTLANTHTTPATVVANKTINTTTTNEDTSTIINSQLRHIDSLTSEIAGLKEELSDKTQRLIKKGSQLGQPRCIACNGLLTSLGVCTLCSVN